MTVPTYNKFIEPILRLLVHHLDGIPAKLVHDAVADSLGLTDEDRMQMLASGAQLVYKNRASWAHDRLKRAGLSSSPKRGVWKITSEGSSFLKAHPAPLSDEETQKIAMSFVHVKKLNVLGAEEESIVPTTAVVAASSVASPDDQLDVAVAELRMLAVSELLEILATVSPSFFERIVLDLLHAMGYGANRADLQQVGGPGDAGIDGVISLDRLGLEKVYVQAKRWQENISRPHLQAFYGALAGQKAKKGVIYHNVAFLNSSA